ncbi:MAG: hypothetical protein LAO51_16860 [Acidobacteriia bacterium]|nr:hypothetical protein [Terriglobia bacterium]
MTSAQGEPAPETTFRSSRSARWLPFALASAMVVAALILAARIDAAGRVPNSAVMKTLLVASAAVLGVRIALSLRELRLRVRVRSKDLLLELGGRTAALAWEDILRVDWDPPFRHYGRWPPALVLFDRRAQRYRVPSLIAGGEQLVAVLLARSGRSDLADWAEAHRLDMKMARGRVWTAAGYLAAAGVLAAAAAAPLR